MSAIARGEDGRRTVRNILAFKRCKRARFAIQRISSRIADRIGDPQRVAVVRQAVLGQQTLGRQFQALHKQPKTLHARDHRVQLLADPLAHVVQQLDLGQLAFGLIGPLFALRAVFADHEHFVIVVCGFVSQDDGLDQTGGRKAGLEMNMDFFLSLISAFTIADVLNQFQYQIRGYETEPGSVDSVTEEVLDDIHGIMRNRKSFDLADSRARFLAGTPFEGHATYLGKILHLLRSPDLVDALRGAGKKYDRVELDPFKVKPIVKITGEFWAQVTEGDGNFNMHRFLEREGAEVTVDQSMFTAMMYRLHMHKELARDRRGLLGGKGRLSHYLAFMKKVGTLTLAERMLEREKALFDDLCEALFSPKDAETPRLTPASGGSPSA